MLWQVLLPFYCYIICWLLHSFCRRCYYPHRHRRCRITPPPSSLYYRCHHIVADAVVVTTFILSCSGYVVDCCIADFVFFIVVAMSPSRTSPSHHHHCPYHCFAVVLLPFSSCVAIVVDCCVWIRGWLLLLLAFVCVLCVFSEKNTTPMNQYPWSRHFVFLSCFIKCNAKVTQVRQGHWQAHYASPVVTGATIIKKCIF